MTRNQIQNRLRELGCKELCDDNKTLVVYNELQFWLSCNRTPMKYITKIWLEFDKIDGCEYICVCLLEDNLFNTGFKVE